ncbi:MAG: acyltransferase [Oscillospiraceae bacterium]|jgi:peptidoglycan/LPS O-acetylase OafA/YrhL|nr:acyltransferase [Oscillospiraceae bacterium]
MRQQATGNRQQATGNRQQATGNRQQATGNRQQATGYLVPLDALRGIAAFIVVFAHYLSSGQLRDGSLLDIVSGVANCSSALAVQLFFVISGFVFCKLYREKIGSGDMPFRQYALLRFSRLFPLYWLTFFIVVASMLIGGVAYVFTPRDLVLNFFMVNQWAAEFIFNAKAMFGVNLGVAPFEYIPPAWSVSNELIAYVVFFAAVYFSRGKSKVIFVLAAIFEVVAFAYLLAFYQNAGFFDFQAHGTTRCLAGFFCGAATYLLYTRAKVKGDKFIAKLKPICLVIIALSVVGFAYALFSTLPRTIEMWFRFYTALNFANATFCPALVVLSLELKPFSRVLSTKILRRIGELSYGIYLWGGVTLMFVFGADEPTRQNFALFHWFNGAKLLHFVVYAVFVLILAELSYRFLERPAQKFLRGRAKKSTTR